MLDEIEFINKYTGYIKKISEKRSAYTFNDTDDYSQEILEKIIREYRIRRGDFPHSNVLTIIHQEAIEVYRKFDRTVKNRALVKERKTNIETEQSRRVKLLQWHNTLEYDDVKNISPTLDTFDLFQCKEAIEIGYSLLESERDKKMFEMFLDDNYYIDIAFEHGLSLERVRQILTRMFAELKSKFDS